MKKTKRGWLIAMVLFLLAALVITIFVLLSRYNYPRYFKDDDDSTLEYNGQTYIKYEDNIWEFLRNYDYNKQIGYGETWQEKIYASENENMDDFVLVQYQKKLLEDKVYLPIIYYKENLKFKNPSVDNVAYIELSIYKDDGKSDRFYLDNKEIVGEIIALANPGNEIKRYTDISILYDGTGISTYSDCISFGFSIDKRNAMDFYILNTYDTDGMWKHYRIPIELIEKIQENLKEQ